MSGNDREVLPSNMVPKNYKVSIYDIDMDKLEFSGDVLITFNVKETTNAIFLNARELAIDKVEVHASISKTESAIAVESVDNDTKSEVLKITLGSEVTPKFDEVKCRIHYKGIIQTNMAGFYRSLYNNGSDYMLSTQFEATDARRAFPCMDEPNLKATFDIKLTIPDHLVGLSNMPLMSSKTPEDGKKKGEPNVAKVKTLTFETTPIMSTYLVAWAVGDFEYVEKSTERYYSGQKLPVRVYTTKGLVPQGTLAVETAAKLIDYFSEVFGIDYALPKADLLAVHEFSHGAMENWGLITYRTTALLYDENTSDEKYKKRVVYVIAHELAHQWFGNLVTMDWWDELWLNEGFATWVGYLALDHLYPDWDIWATFASESTQEALRLDGLRGSHPIHVPVHAAADIDQVFDAISYLKGASIIRMLAAVIGSDVFLKGVGKYLASYRYSNATASNLWDSISDVAGFDVNTMMSNWIESIGYPVLTVTTDGNGSYTVTQDRFLATGDMTEEENGTLWHVPLFCSSSSAGTKSVLTEKSMTLAVDSLEAYFKLNTRQSGVYRVIYPMSLLETLSRNNSQLQPVDRMGIIADCAAAASAGLSSSVALLSYLSTLAEEDSYVVWLEAINRLSHLISISYSNPELKNQLVRFAASLVAPAVSKLGLSNSPGDNYITKQLRTDLYRFAGQLGVPEVVQDAVKKFNEWKDNGVIDPSYRLGIWSTVLAQSDCSVESFEAVLKEVTNPSTLDAREVALNSISKVSSDSILSKALSLLTDFSKVPPMDIHFLSGGLGRNTVAKKEFLAFVLNESNWSLIYDKLSSNMVVLDRFVKTSLKDYASKEDFDLIKSFFEKKDLTGFDRGVQQVLDQVTVNSNWILRDSEEMIKWLQSR